MAQSLPKLFKLSKPKFPPAFLHCLIHSFLRDHSSGWGSCSLLSPSASWLTWCFPMGPAWCGLPPSLAINFFQRQLSLCLPPYNTRVKQIPGTDLKKVLMISAFKMKANVTFYSGRWLNTIWVGSTCFFSIGWSQAVLAWSLARQPFWKWAV